MKARINNLPNWVSLIITLPILVRYIDTLAKTISLLSDGKIPNDEGNLGTKLNYVSIVKTTIYLLYTSFYE